jgi:D-alanyl-D-alanine carboxypeptidase
VLDNTIDGSGGSSLYHLATPGTKYAYSNFGYCVLGRVIEKITGQSYTNYVQQNIQSRCGISNMNIAGNALVDRRADEAQYFGQNGEDPYGMNVARMDSHGGWLASSIDYLRFMVRVDGFQTKPDILLPADITSMTTGSTANANYAMGWSLSPPNWWHNGSLPGTQTIMVRTPDGFCWAALFNSRGGSTGNDQDTMMWAIHDSVKAWPSYDLF